MLFDASISFDKERAAERLKWLFEKNKVFQITVVNPRRSVSQNSYLHLILTWYALEYGETADWIKQEVFKKQINPEIFKTEYINEKTGEIRDAWKSTAELDTAQMTTAIERFRNYSAKEAGIYLPEPNDLAGINAIDIEIKKSNHKYL